MADAIRAVTFIFACDYLTVTFIFACDYLTVTFIFACDYLTVTFIFACDYLPDRILCEKSVHNIATNIRKQNYMTAHTG